MLGKSAFAVFALATSVAASVAAVPQQVKTELRLIKLSDEDPGTWMTEQEKFEKLQSKHISFVDVTETPNLETQGAARIALDKRQSTGFPSGPTHQSIANPLIAKLSQANLQTNTNTLCAIYNRYYKGSYSGSSATTMYNMVVSAAKANTAIVVSKFTHSYNQPSVIARIPGASAEVVVMGAHYDTINQASVSGRAPGADDDTSGITVLLEALRVLSEAKFKGENTIEFHFYSGEEGGLLGSRDIFNSYSKAGTQVLAMLAVDMAGYSPRNHIVLFTDYVDTSLTNFIKTLVPVYTKLPVATDKCGYACSDHGSARAAGYKAAYVADEVIADSSPYIHTASDTVSTLSFSYMFEHAKLFVGFAVEASYF